MLRLPRLLSALCISELACLACSRQAAAQATSQPAPPPPPPLAGIRVADPLIIESLTLVETGRTKEAVSLLRSAVAPGRRHTQNQRNELRLGLGLVLLRVGDRAEARKVLQPLSRLQQPPTLANRAQVLLGVLARQSKPPRDKQLLRPPAAWEAALVGVVGDLTAEVRRDHEAVAHAITQRRWTQAGSGLDRIEAVMQRAAAVDLEAASLAQRDLLVVHSGLLAAETHVVNAAVAEMIRVASNLAGQMSHRHDQSTKHTGYLPADVVTRYNAAVDEIMTANALGERIVATYLRVVDTSDGRIKRDATVRMSKTSLPAKRPIFGQ